MRPRSQWLSSLVASLVLAASTASAQRSAIASPVVQMLRTAPDARTRAQAALSLARLPSADAPAALRDALSDPAAVVRAAAASSLADLRDAGSIAALQARLQDPDDNVRDAVTRALARLGTPSASATFEAPQPVDLTAVRFLVRPGELADREGSDAARVDLLRDAVRGALRNRGTVALHPGLLPAAAQRRLRSGSLRQFSLDGGLQTVRRVPGPDGERLRAEVNLVIVSEPQHAIVGMVTGAASLPVPYGHDAAALRRSEATLITSAVQAALRDVESYLAQTP